MILKITSRRLSTGWLFGFLISELFGQSHIYFVCLYTKTCEFADQKRFLCHAWDGIWFVKHTLS